MSISSGFRLLLILKGGSSSLYFGPFYHITFLKRRPIVIKVDFWCTRPSSEAFSRFSSSFLFLVSIQCAVPTPPPLMACISFRLTHTHLLLPLALVRCLLPGSLIAAFVTLTAVFLLWLIAWLPWQLLCHCLSAILPLLPPSYPAPLPHVGTSCAFSMFRTKLITFPMVCHVPRVVLLLIAL